MRQEHLQDAEQIEIGLGGYSLGLPHAMDAGWLLLIFVIVSLFALGALGRTVTPTDPSGKPQLLSFPA